MDVAETGYTQTQLQRLGELEAKGAERASQELFEDAWQRDREFQQRERKGVRANREQLRDLVEETREPRLCELTRKLSARLIAEGFTQVVTPTVITAKQLDRMSIHDDNPLREQVFWTDRNHCLRPMLAPGLYTVSRKLMNSVQLPFKVFEIGSCFRKESEGRTHLEEFTMVNVVEWGTPLEERDERLRGFVELIMDAAEVGDWHFEAENSVVYGDGLDAVDGNGLELSSTSMGPHPLDAAWAVDCSWVGVGVGLERLLQSREKTDNIHRFARSVTYLDGAALNIK